MRIAYDLQACLTDSRDRGIGRYAHNLVSEMVRIGHYRGDVESVLALDGTDPARLQETRHQLRREKLPAQTAVYAYPPSAVTDIEPWRADAAAALRGRFFEALAPDVMLHTSHFETGTNYTTGIKWNDGTVPSAVIAYDLIPLVFPERYLPPGHFISDIYPKKCLSFRDYDRFLAISEATRADLMQYLDIPRERIRVIGAGLDPALLAAARTGSRFHEEILGQLGIRQPFVLMVGNGDWRKNTLGTIEAFARLPKAITDHHLLVLTQVGDDVKQALAGALRHIAGRVRVLGKVDDDTLATLYHHCAVFFFPSFYEGFGLPVLEAMAFGAPVLSSGLGSLPEVVHDDRCLFDPRDEDATVAILGRALDDRDFREVLKNGAVEHAHGFTWDRCAEAALEVVSELAGSAESVGMAKPDFGELRVTGSDIATWSEFVRMAPADLQGLEHGLRVAAGKGRRRILLDITEVVRMDARSGIQRVVRNFCAGLDALAGLGGGFELLPIWWTEQGVFQANQFACDRLGMRREGGDVPLQVQANDLLMMLDSSWWMPERFDGLQADVRALGGEVVWMVYDLIPILMPETCDTGMAETFGHWLRHAVATTDGFVCISEATREDLERFMDQVQGYARRPWTRSVHLGSDLDRQVATAPGAATLAMMDTLNEVPFLLAIGTLEPRKDYATMLAAFERSRAAGTDCALVIVGKQGWNVDSLAKKIRSHPEAGRRLFWLEGIEDGDLAFLLARTAALVQASLSEGFGLPIVEAGSQGSALLLSDIAVFREIAGDAADYFPAGDASRLSALIDRGVRHGFRSAGRDAIRTKTWNEVSAELARLLLG